MGSVQLPSATTYSARSMGLNLPPKIKHFVSSPFIPFSRLDMNMYPEDCDITYSKGLCAIISDGSLCVAVIASSYVT